MSRSAGGVNPMFDPDIVPLVNADGTQVKRGDFGHVTPKAFFECAINTLEERPGLNKGQFAEETPQSGIIDDLKGNVCLLGAMMVGGKKFATEHDIPIVTAGDFYHAAKIAAKYLPESYQSPRGAQDALSDFNDAPVTTKEDVINLFKVALTDPAVDKSPPGVTLEKAVYCRKEEADRWLKRQRPN